jgi:hypothetical protein
VARLAPFFSNRLMGAVREGIRRRSAFFGSALEPLDGSSPGTAFVPLLIVGREHYQEKWMPTPTGSWLESLKLGFLQREVGLDSVVALTGAADGSQQLIVYRMKPESVRQFPPAILWIPESLLLSRAVTNDDVLEVSRDGVGFFVSQAGASQVKGGLLQSAERYAYAVGLPDGAVRQIISREHLVDALWSGLTSISYRDWPLLMKPGLGGELVRRLKPVAIWSCFLLMAYWAAVSVYLEGMIRFRSSQIEGLGAQVETLIERDRSNDRLASERNALLQIDSANAGFLRVWETVGAVWKLGGAVDNVKRGADNTVVISGSAPVATDVVVAVSAIAGVSSVRFVSPVVQGGRGEIFSIQYTMVDP